MFGSIRIGALMLGYSAAGAACLLAARALLYYFKARKAQLKKKPERANAEGATEAVDNTKAEKTL